ncbi:MAG: DNA mismatch repair protein MutS [Heyndrickxia faecalis]|jgi:DNA mismatch repair protein MutS|uniref:DNA mismatch repair protein MutS n=1 Tax=Heyndrickxia coagulans 36D1 TaxID=345219 RepID=G2TMI7_HEYCO|nr:MULTISPECIES: DNA mismatch repair protein MutS [Heyndrickxia]AEP02485.1 DNA mismatch repair protein MutS [Heyndrickxia coagulans 36D1]APB35972.1 DNA mismatch repair protein MutS [Heyndrickxia coagulans]AVD55931.1 DNA mismatch repair protein MutS [Heyndrickxia coagulans]MCI1575389.1 DNA mismatch repair protein MutS [Heyndrickxia coagulans]MED4920623.1 DNA mismatch repair protein MutS [Weizmannia sp. CD-2023]
MIEKQERNLVRMAAYTPMIQQYLQVKAEYQDAFLFFRLGDFYEMFFEDAIKASQELEITLTSRDGGGDEKIPMCGVPYHSASTYIEQLIDKGYKVAICEQMEDPKLAKGVVKREVIQLITPGTLMEGKSLAEKENHYIASVASPADGNFAIAYIDLSTGEGRACLLEGPFEEVLNELASIGAKEAVVDPEFPDEYARLMKNTGNITISFETDTAVKEGFERLLPQLEPELLRLAAARLLNYLFRTQKRSLDHLQPVEMYEVRRFLNIDYYSKRNLELTETIRGQGKKGSLLWLLDETMTAMGGRLLKQWIGRPLLKQEKIEARLQMVETFLNHYFEREDIRERLKEVYDLERLAGRVAFGNVNARDLIQLKCSLQQIPGIRAVMESLESPESKKLAALLDPCEELTDLLERAIEDNPPVSVKEGGMIRDGYNEELDRYRDASKNGKQWIASLERDERERTGIKSLKVGYNRVFGYYIEVTKANLHLLEEGRYERKQTLANAERFITPELKEKEALILQAEERMIDLEYELFTEIRAHVKEFIPRLQRLAKAVSTIDVLQSFAVVSEKRHYTKPVFREDGVLKITEGRHPVVEKVLDSQSYVPNDCLMDENREILLITGPNMSGKSTYMRQIALTVILAQIGCFVPAREAELPVFDRIFTRIGAADDLISGQSTFMVEMLEAKNAIANATERSLILFDEIGRGTSTYDGMALAQAMIEYIHDEIGAKTLFSTHYHELTALSTELGKLQNVHVSAMEQNGKVVFLHKIKEGPADKSYGIHVAKLAGLPEQVICRAEKILHALENQDNGETQMNPPEAAAATEPAQLSFFEEPETPRQKTVEAKERKVLKQIRELDLLEMTPLAAMNALYEIQKKLKK